MVKQNYIYFVGVITKEKSVQCIRFVIREFNV